MAGVNKVILVGFLGRDVETRHTRSDSAVANIRMATKRSWKDRNSGEWREQTEWHSVVAWDPSRRVQELKRGAQVYVEGRLETRKWTDRDGNERSTTEVRAERIFPLGRREDGPGGGGGEYDQRGAGGYDGQQHAPASRSEPREPQAGDPPGGAAGEAAPAQPAPAEELTDDDIPF